MPKTFDGYKFQLTVEMGNDAMRTVDDIADMLEATAQKIRSYGVAGVKIQDMNGNTVGETGLVK